MFDAILNAIAERSQTLKDKDAEIATWSELANGLQETGMELRELVADADARMSNLRAKADRAYDAERAANARTEAAESQLLQIAEALGLGAVDRGEVVMPPEQQAAEEAEAPAQEG